MELNSDLGCSGTPTSSSLASTLEVWGVSALSPFTSGGVVIPIAFNCKQSKQYYSHES